MQQLTNFGNSPHNGDIALWAIFHLIRPIALVFFNNVGCDKMLHFLFLQLYSQNRRERKTQTVSALTILIFNYKRRKRGEEGNRGRERNELIERLEQPALKCTFDDKIFASCCLPVLPFVESISMVFDSMCGMRRASRHWAKRERVCSRATLITLNQGNKTEAWHTAYSNCEFCLPYLVS